MAVANARTNIGADKARKKGEHAYRRSLSDDGTDRAYKTDAP